MVMATANSYADTSSHHSLTSNKSNVSKYSVYQTNDKPLSNEAIYRAKMKYGIFNNPARVSIGVDPSASDTAAVLAANTDLSINSYSKELSSEAAHAALIAKPDSVVGWKRNRVAPEAEYAAMSAKSMKFPFDNFDTSSTAINDDAAAAVSVLKKTPKNVAREALNDLYEFDDVRSGKVTLSKFQDVKSNNSLKNLNIKQDNRGGVKTSNLAIEKTRSMNIGNITKNASKAADELLNKRLNPEKNHRSGLKSTLGTDKSTIDSKIYINNIYNQSISASKKELSKTYTRSYGLETPSDKGLTVYPSNFAASALNLKPSKNENDVDFEATVKDNLLVNKNIYAYASENVNKKLSKMDADVASQNIFSNAKINERAFIVAQENAAKRKAKDVPYGSIALGGGLVMKYDEVHQIASSLVQPAISDMETRIVETKTLDQQRKELPAKIRERNAELKEEQRLAQIALEKKRAEEAKARRDQLVVDQNALEEEHENKKVELSGIFDARDEEFQQQVTEEEAAKKEIDDERAEKLKVLNDTKAENDAVREEELNQMKAERDEAIAPLLKEHQTESDKLDELVSAREAKESVYNEEKAKADAIQSELDETLSKLEIMNQRIAELEADLPEISNTAAVSTSAALAAETRLNTDGKEQESKLEPLADQRKELESNRQDLHSKIAEKSTELKSSALEHHEEEKKINELYPEHLRKEVEVPGEINDDDLSDSKFPLDDSTIDIPPEIEEEPENVPEEVWPKVEEPEVEKPEEEPVEEPVEEGAIAKSSAPTKVVNKKTWEEVKASGYAEGGDPLVNVPTAEKPPMADVVDQTKINESINTTKNFKATKATGAGAGKGVAGARNTPDKSSGKSKGLFGFFKSNKQQPKQAVASKPVSQPVVVDSEAAKKKFKGLQTEETETKPVEKKALDNNDEDVFSGFSQGSEIDEA